MPKTSEGGHFHLNPMAMWLTLTIHCDQQSASSLLTPTLMLSSSPCHFHVISPSRTYFYLHTHQEVTILPPQHMTISMHSVCHSQVVCCFILSQHLLHASNCFLSLNCAPHIALSIHLTIPKIPILFSLRHHISLPY